MMTMHNDPQARIHELLKTEDLEALTLHLVAVLSKEHLDMYGRSEHVSKDHVITILVETTDHYFGESGTYRLLASKPEIEFKVIEKK